MNNLAIAQIVSPGPDTRLGVALIVKAAYRFEQHQVVALDKPVPVAEAETYDDPGNPVYAEVMAETDTSGFKPTTDVIVTGQAYAPRGKRAYHLDCSVTTGPLHKTVRVFGHRTISVKAFGALAFLDPEPFESHRLGYRSAYGGRCRGKDDSVFTFLPNPVGIGFGIKGGPKGAAELTLPLQEDPENLLTPDSVLLARYDDWKRMPLPASLGWTRQTFYPRCTLAGLLPEYNGESTGNKALLPALDPSFFQGASNGLYGQRLTGGEAVRLEYCNPDFPVLEFTLPTAPVHFNVAGPFAAVPQLLLQTVTIDTDTHCVTMLWRSDIDGSAEDLPGTLLSLRWNAEPV